MFFFRYMGTKTFVFSSKNLDFLPKTTKFGPKLTFLVILGQALLAHLVPCWWVGWWLWCADCIWQDTYLLYYVVDVYVDDEVSFTFSEFQLRFIEAVYLVKAGNIWARCAFCNVLN